MSLSPLIPLAGAALGSLALKVVRHLPKAPSFADVLKGVTADGATPSNGDEPSAQPLWSDSGPHDIQSLRRSANEALLHFQRRLLLHLPAAGIDPSYPIQLQGDGFDGVTVTNDHPDRAAIEAIFSRDGSLTDLFNDLSAIYGQLERLRSHHSLASHGWSPSSHQLSSSSWPFDPDARQFNLVIQGERIEAGFQPLG